jgi:hypothetical protein
MVNDCDFLVCLGPRAALLAYLHTSQRCKVSEKTYCARNYFM